MVVQSTYPWHAWVIFINETMQVNLHMLYTSLCLIVKPLGVDDLRVVQKELYVARPHWYNMGLELGLKPDVLDAIKFRCSGDECFRETLKDYLKMTTPSWMALVEALRSPTVGQSQLAEKVEQKYCPSLRLPGKLLNHAV